ncbi:MAG: response regulator [Rhodanobacteraceae bacterium]|nr:response regulator [Xanthomonadales bacterium]MCP5478242.1 response regulator [Rhodanobacteraceae bacterium]HPF72930.1 response regulator [Xanthomonadaceae bacterium]HRX99973.1 response regulator [Xanthomonadaceae bacterium]
MRSQVLVVEDEPRIATALRDYLEASEFEVTVLDRGDLVTDWLRLNHADAVLLDVMLPGIDGLTLCREIRRASEIPILMLTARVEDVDRLLGLELGADDYICKPFNLREVVLRLRAVLRRFHATATSGDLLPFELDTDRLEVVHDGRKLALTPVETRLLAKLCERPGKIYSRSQLQDAAYDDHRVVNDRTVDSHVRNLRRKLESFGLDPIASVYGVGFRLQL